MRGKKFDQNLFKSTKKAIALRKISKFFRESLPPDPLESFFPQFASKIKPGPPKAHSFMSLQPLKKTVETDFKNW